MTDILVKYRYFPALEIELASNTVATGYRQLVAENVNREPPIFRDQCRYTAQYFEQLAIQVRDQLGWQWVNADYNNFETTTLLHKRIEEYIGGPTDYMAAPAEHHELMHEIHYCLHAIQHNSSRGQWLQVEWYNNDGFFLPPDFEFQMELKFGDIKLQNPYVGHCPLLVWEQNDYTNVSQTCKFHDFAKPGINIVIENYQPRRYSDGHPYDQGLYLSWFREHGIDFLAEFGESQLLHYTGWPVVGRVTNLDVLTDIKAAPLLELESVQVV
jgi:hypothetical protein